MVTQTIAFDTVSISEIESSAVTAFLFSGTTLVATLAAITENATLKGRYTGAVTDIAAGTYRLVIKFDGITISEPEYQVELLLAVGTYSAAMSYGTSGGGAGDASQETVEEVLDVANSIAAALAGSSPVEPTGVTVFELLEQLVAVVSNIDDRSFTIDDIWNALSGGNGLSVFDYLQQLSNAGTGENTVTVTVNDGTFPLQNAIVRIIDGGITYTAITNVSGVAVFQLDDATYVVAISKAGYSYAGTTLVVDADEAVTYSMTLNTLVLPSLGQVARRAIPVTVFDRIT